MTYCIGLALDEGLVFASDSRTNAGIDNIRTVRKMHVFAVDGHRVIVALSAGNLSTTQNALNLIEHRGKHDPTRPGIFNATSMFQVAQHLGDALREVSERDEAYLKDNGIDASGSFIVGGQIRGEAPRLFLVYSEGNYVEVSEDSPYFQTGEIKFGKSVLDRVLERDMSMTEACKCVLVAFDSTMHSNLSVGPPVDVLTYKTDSLILGARLHLEDGDPYLQQVHEEWDATLRQGVQAITGPDWMSDSAG